MLQEKHRLRIQDALSQYFNSPFTVTIKIGSGGNYAPSPIEKKMADQKASTENALKKFNQDPALNKLLNNFDGKILSDTIELS